MSPADNPAAEINRTLYVGGLGWVYDLGDLEVVVILLEARTAQAAGAFAEAQGTEPSAAALALAARDGPPEDGATANTAILFTTNTVLSSFIGVIYLDDRVRPGFTVPRDRGLRLCDRRCCRYRALRVHRHAPAGDGGRDMGRMA